MSVSDFIIYTLSNIFMSIVFTYAFSKIFSKEIKYSAKNIFIIILFSALYTINNYYNVVTMKIIIAFVISLLLQLILYKLKIKETFIVVMILTLISIILEFLLSPLVAIFITDSITLNNSLVIKILFSVINSLILMLLMRIRIIVKYIKNIQSVINKFTNFYTISIILICSLNIIMYIFSYNLRNTSLLIVFVISILIMLICLKTIINDKYNNKLLKEKNKILKDEHKAYSNTIDECRELKHNLKNELYSIKAKLPKEGQNLINSIITKYNNNYEWINTLNDIPEGLQGLIYLKIHEAKLKKIKIFLNIKSSLKTKDNDYLELSTILGILIDNAIEASVIAKSKTMVINITEEKNIININILNKYVNNINTNDIGKKNYSTKEYKSGLGLNFINKLNKRDIKVNFKITNDLFNTRLVYFNKKIK